MIVGQRIRRPDAADKVKGSALYIEDLAAAGALWRGCCARRTPTRASRASTSRGARPARRPRRAHRGRHPGPEPHPDDPGRLAGAGARASCATSARRWPWWPRRSRRRWRRRWPPSHVEYEPLPAAARHGGGARARARSSRTGRSAAARPAVALARCGRGRGRGHVPHAVPGARLHRAQRHDRGARRRGRRRGATARCSARSTCRRPWPPRSGCDLEPGAHRADRDRRRLRRQGGRAVRARAPRPRSSPAPPAAPVRLILTPRRGHGRDVQAPSRRASACARARRADGHLVGCEVDYLLDGGAYATLSPVVLFRGTVHACGPYRVPNVTVDARVVRTHKVPCGAFRGFGEPQVVFACESQMDLLAERLGMDPLELRRRNALRDRGRDDHRAQAHRERRLPRGAGQGGGRRRTGRRKRDGLRARHAGRCGAASASPPATTAWAWARWASTSTRRARASWSPADGSVTVAVGTTEIGQGMITVLSQIAAEALGCPVELVRVVEPDTSRVPDSGPTVASRTTVMSGNAIRDAAAKIRAAMEPVIADSGLPWRGGGRALRAEAGRPGRARLGGAAAPPPSTSTTGQGEAYICYSFSANVVEVEVDTETGETRVVARLVRPRRRPRHQPDDRRGPGRGRRRAGPRLRAGRGARAASDGRILNDQFSTYIIPTTPRHARRSSPSSWSTRSRGDPTAPRAWARRRSSRWPRR